MYKLALGKMGMSEIDFLNTTPRAFALKVEGWATWEADQSRSEWERTRWAVAVGMSPHLKKPIKPTDLFRFDDEKSTTKEIDKEADAKINRIAAKWRPK